MTMPEGATWAIFDPDGNVVQYGTEPIELQMTTLLGDATDTEEK